MKAPNGEEIELVKAFSELHTGMLVYTRDCGCCGRDWCRSMLTTFDATAEDEACFKYEPDCEPGGCCCVPECVCEQYEDEEDWCSCVVEGCKCFRAIGEGEVAEGVVYRVVDQLMETTSARKRKAVPA